MSKVYQVITDRIISLLEQGTVPWHRPWSGGVEALPKNLCSGREYRGINVFMLWSAGYPSPYWITFRQAKERGGNVRKGERGFPVIFWNWFKPKDREEDTAEGNVRRGKVPFLRYYTVFNVTQCDGIDAPAPPAPAGDFEPIAACEGIVSGMPRPPAIRHGGAGAWYRPTTDTVDMPPPESFESPEHYYSTLFHELTHATGHESRLSRPGVTEPIKFGSRIYSREELIAEMGAAFLSGHVGIENRTIEDSASYIAGWLRRLRNDNRLVVQAAAGAQRAADYILGRTWPGDGDAEGGGEGES